MDRFAEHAKVSGSEILMSDVSNVAKDDHGFIVTTHVGIKRSRALILATGNKYKKLGVP